MATTAVPITKLPPGPERPELHFDQHITGCEQYPVSAKFAGGDDWASPGIAYEDYQRMATRENKLAPNRRYATPVWALDNELLQAVLATYMESRAFMRWWHHEPGGEKERIDLAQKIIVLRQDPVQKNTLARLCREYVELKHSGPLSDDEQRRKRLLECEIEGLDTVLRTNARIGALVAAIAYLYYRRGMSSVGVGEELNLKPPHIRQVLWRLQRCWERMGGEKPKQISQYRPPARHWTKPDRKNRVIRIEHFNEPKPVPVEDPLAPTPYNKYQSYCTSVGVQPMKEVEWHTMYGSSGLLVKNNDCVSNAAIRTSWKIDAGMARRAVAEMKKPVS